MGHSHARELEQAAAFATFGPPVTVPQGAFTWQLHELATVLLEDSAKICYPYTSLINCKWTSIFITCIQHPWIPSAGSEGTRQPRQALHTLLLRDLLLSGHRRRFCHPALLSVPRTVSSHSGTAHLQPHSREQASPWKMPLLDSSSSPGEKKVLGSPSPSSGRRAGAAAARGML